MPVLSGPRLSDTLSGRPTIASASSTNSLTWWTLESLAPVANNPRYSFVQADIVDAAKIKDIFASYEPDIVMHLAAESHVDRSIDGPAAFIQTNIIGTYTLLEAAAHLLARFAEHPTKRFSIPPHFD